MSSFPSLLMRYNNTINTTRQWGNNNKSFIVFMSRQTIIMKCLHFILWHALACTSVCSKQNMWRSPSLCCSGICHKSWHLYGKWSLCEVIIFYCDLKLHKLLLNFLIIFNQWTDRTVIILFMESNNLWVDHLNVLFNYLPEQLNSCIEQFWT